MKTSAKVRLSPTTLSRWYELGCPAAWRFDRSLTLLEKNVHLDLGRDVHSLMSGEKSEAQVDNPAAISIYRKLVEARGILGLTALFDPKGRALSERKHEWEISPGIVFVRQIDLIATDGNGEIVIVDWKSTLGYGWKKIVDSKGELIAPQTLGPQSPGYLLTPPRRILRSYGLPGWPKKMYYLVGPARGPVQVETYHQEPDDEDNLKTALRQAAVAIRSGEFPKLYSKRCLDCPYQKACFRTPGWETAYRLYVPSGKLEGGAGGGDAALP